MTDEPLGSHVLELQLTDVVEETADARSLVFGVPDGPDAPDIPADRLRYSPGQFLTLRVPSDRTGSVARCYSLCSSPFTGDPLTVTVKRTAGRIRIELAVRPRARRDEDPCAGTVGHLRPQDPGHRLPAAGGGQRHHADDVDLQVGARRRQRQGRPDLRQSGRELGDLRRRTARTGGQVPRSAHRRALARQRAGTPERGRSGRAGRAVFSDTTHTSAARDRSWSRPRKRSRPSARNASTSRCSSRWTPTRSLRWSLRTTTATKGPPPLSSRSTVRTHEISWPRNAKLLDVLLDKGLDAPFSCREGHCGACAVLKKSGDVEMEVNDVLEQSDLDEGLILGCQAKPDPIRSKSPTTNSARATIRGTEFGCRRQRLRRGAM